MRSFSYHRVDTADAAVRASDASAQFIAGGVTLVDLMKLDVMRPVRLVGIADLPGGIEETEAGLRLGGSVRMAQAAEHPVIQRSYPVIADALRLAASPQIRNMATLAGNVLQRTRCGYFRDVGTPECNKRVPGSGCAAIAGHNRLHAVLGTSDACIASYPGDLAQALIVLDTVVQIQTARGPRTLPFADLHRAPGDTPQVETALAPGEVITGFLVPRGTWTRRSLYLKIRDRQSYAFALASAAVALDLDGDIVRAARIALGGIATRPWRATAAEAVLVGQRLDDTSIAAAADAALDGAAGLAHNSFKIELGKRTVARALRDAGRMEIPA